MNSCTCTCKKRLNLREGASVAAQVHESIRYAFPLKEGITQESIFLFKCTLFWTCISFSFSANHTLAVIMWLLLPSKIT